MTRDDLLAAYDERRALYAAFAATIRDLFAQLLEGAGVKVHGIYERTKERESFIKKISREGGTYVSLEEVTDIVGLRVITFFSDDVDKVASIVRKEFVVDSKNSVDKRVLLDPDRFGYLSLHFIVQLHPTRAALAEYRRYSSLRAEIQIRSVLQHAWAEIEHDLGYKAKIEVPAVTQRQFFRLAGLLELADEEFKNIRDTLRKYAEDVPQKIRTNPENVPIDSVSLQNFVTTSELVQKLDRDVATALGRLGATQKANNQYVAALLPKLAHFGIANISNLVRALDECQSEILALAGVMNTISNTPSEARAGPVFEGISIFYLTYILALRTRDGRKVENYVTSFGLGVTPEAQREFAAGLTRWYTSRFK